MHMDRATKGLHAILLSETCFKGPDSSNESRSMFTSRGLDLGRALCVVRRSRSDTMLSVTLDQPAASESPFPVSPRILYGKNPLIEVTCQLQFAPVLKIESEVPATFQDAVRSEYPLFRERRDVLAGVPAEFPPQIVALLRAQSVLQKNHPGYEFTSSDEQWTIGLSRDRFSLSCRHYQTWEHFQSRLVGPMEAMLANYQPAFFTRISLRYQNVVQRSKLGLTGTAWSDLLQPHIAGLLALSNLDVAASQSVALVRFEGDRGQVSIRHGLVQSADNKEECYLIDSDFYSERRTTTNDAVKCLTFFNAQSGRLFRWCISDPLHAAMAPQPIEPLLHSD